MMNNEFNLTVIGGGPGGYAAAIRASQLGLKVALVEEAELGGTCLNRGCIPTKSLLHSSELYSMTRHFSEFGIEIKDLAFNYTKAASKKHAVVKQLRRGVEALVKNSGCCIFAGRGLIKSTHTVEVTGKDHRIITTDNIIIATGSMPSIPPIPGIESARVLVSDDVLNLKECPEKVVIIGGGVIGMEFATIFNALGKAVTVVEMTGTILSGVDVEISEICRKIIERKGVAIFTESKVMSLKSDSGTICIFENNGTEMGIEADMVIVAAGRKPKTEGIGLENIGILTEQGFINVNERMETSIKGIYAIGDITGKPMLAHVATAQGLVVASNAAGKDKIMNYSVIPACIYTNPEIATVGLTEAEALKKGLSIKIGRFPISANGKSIIMGEKEGLAKLIADADTGEILGAHIIGPRATDMIAEICIAMKLESTIEEVADTIHPHPSISEIIMEAAHDIEGLCIHKPGK